MAVFDHISREIEAELVLCTTLNVLRLQNTMSQLSNAVFGEYFHYLEHFLRHFENQKILTFWGELWGIFITLPIGRFQAHFSIYPDFGCLVTNMSVLLDSHTSFPSPRRVNLRACRV